MFKSTEEFAEDLQNLVGSIVKGTWLPLNFMKRQGGTKNRNRTAPQALKKIYIYMYIYIKAGIY